MTVVKLLTLGQGVYFAVTGLWPLLHLPSFERLTAPKVDKWLVRMVGALALAVGIPLLRAGFRGAPSSDFALVAVLSAIAFAAVDVVYVARGRIRKIYLGDAAVEAVFLVGWAIVWSQLS